MDYIVVGIIVFILSVIFFIGGVGSVIVIVLIMMWFGIFFMVVKFIGFFINIFLMFLVMIKNIKYGKFDYCFGCLILVMVMIFVFFGVYLGKFIFKEYVFWIFIIFFLYFGIMMIFFKLRLRDGDGNYIVEGLFIGGLVGFFGGLFGVGGGGIISLMFIMFGYELKKVVVIMVLVVFFLFLSGFFIYWGMGVFDWKFLGVVLIFVIMGGWFGIYFMYFKMSFE